LPEEFSELSMSLAGKPANIHGFVIQSEYLSGLIIGMALWMEQNPNYFVMSMPCRTNRLFTN
jgi:hypothetical protein